ncbi:hypothetical protein FH972_022374 [Carpinus fangiana]|uniref:Uncharacterized protein n=1 Tax=Carpinus fangiana TaxID=176857 RepID=A0A5N6KSR2_9ROSI|nr:hypothetical protein FH972_022374 [Carpinus fangiana]
MAPAGKAGTVDSSKSWDPKKFILEWEKDSGAIVKPLGDNDLETSIKKAFALKWSDSYVYHATASVTLHQVQIAINAGDKHGMHAWYVDDEGKQAPDIEAYTAIFASTTSTAAALTALTSNAKKDSLRASIAANLIPQRLFLPNIKIPKRKPVTAHQNPYLDYWAWSCRCLEWAGPNAATVRVRISHHILPILYHHFGCVCPSFEALEIIRQLAHRWGVLELGSGNGYWAFMLRQLGVSVTAVDNGDSLWRTMWIDDTVREDGVRYLGLSGGRHAVLLLVYPQTTTAFTKSVLANYRGDTICVAGTQNKNGFTAFSDRTIDEYMREEHPEFKMVIQTPLPSFAGKDEAFFVFERLERRVGDRGSLVGEYASYSP